jgi:CheY-like chemotaxis protein
MDGWAVLSALKEDESLAEIPVVMVSILDDTRLGFALGASEYVTKPIDRERLVSVLRRFIGDDGARPVLVVEDDEATRLVVRRVLEAEGCDVAEAANGRIGLDRLAEQRPSLVLLDLVMPEMDGFEFLEAMREQSDLATVPVIVVTAKELTEDDRRRLNGGVERIVSKGALAPDALAEHVRELVTDRSATGGGV